MKTTIWETIGSIAINVFFWGLIFWAVAPFFIETLTLLHQIIESVMTLVLGPP